jgi:hypothetical protein
MSRLPLKSAFLAGAFLPLLFGGCATYYQPGSQNVPLLARPGESVLNASIRGFYPTPQWSLHAAFSPVDRLGLLLNADFNNRPDIATHMMEGGIGGYAGDTSGWLLEAYALGGAGELRYRSEAKGAFPFTFYDNTVRARMYRLALQPAIGFRGEDHQVAVSARFGYLFYDKVRDRRPDSLGVDEAYLRSHSRMLLVEPAVTLRGGLPWCMAQIQVGTSLNLTDPRFKQSVVWGALGVVFRPPPLKLF